MIKAWAMKNPPMAAGALLLGVVAIIYFWPANPEKKAYADASACLQHIENEPVPCEVFECVVPFMVKYGASEKADLLRYRAANDRHSDWCESRPRRPVAETPKPPAPPPPAEKPTPPPTPTPESVTPAASQAEVERPLPPQPLPPGTPIFETTTPQASPSDAHKADAPSRTSPASNSEDKKILDATRFRTRRGISYVAKGDVSFSSPTPENCAARCVKHNDCGRATFWYGSNRCFLFAHGSRFDDFGHRDKAISFIFE